MAMHACEYHHIWDKNRQSVLASCSIINYLKKHVTRYTIPKVFGVFREPSFARLNFWAILL